MKISLWPQPSRSTDELLAEARWADQHRWHSIWFADHYMPDTGSTQIIDGPQHEAWAVVSAWAAITEHLRIGTLVSPTTVHHPAVLANRAATLDHLSGGRFTLGLGAGWQINEHAAYGIDLLEPKPRVDRFEEAITIIGSLLSHERTTFAGNHFQITDAPCDPKPMQSPLPLLVGTRGPRMMRITARHAHQWNGWGLPEVAIPNRDLLVSACQRVGRPEPMWTSANAMIDLGGESRGGRRPVIAGSPQQVIDTLGAYVEAGFDEFIVPSWNLGDTLPERLDRLDQIHTDVVTALTA